MRPTWTLHGELESLPVGCFRSPSPPTIAPKVATGWWLLQKPHLRSRPRSYWSRDGEILSPNQRGFHLRQNLGHHNEDESREVEMEEEKEAILPSSSWSPVHLWRKQHEERRRPLFPRVDQVSRLQRDCFSSAFWQRGGGGCDCWDDDPNLPWLFAPTDKQIPPLSLSRLGSRTPVNC